MPDAPHAKHVAQPQMPTTDAQRRLEESKQQVLALLRDCQFSEVLVRLVPLTRPQGPGSESYVAWAQQELTRLRALPPDVVQKGPALVPEAIKLLAQQNFAQVIRLLEYIPPEFRTPEAVSLLQQARAMQGGVEQLNERMQQAIHNRQYDGLRESVLERLLEVEPGNLTARDLYEHLGTYGPGEALRFDKDGMVLPARGKYWWLERLAQLLYQRLTRRTQPRTKTGTRRKGEPVPAEDRGSGVPVAALAIGLGSLCVLILLLGVVLLLHSGGETVKVEIDPALAGDATISVWLDGQLMEIAGLGATIKLQPGAHGYEIRRGDEVIVAREFTVLKDDNPALRISVEAVADARGKTSPEQAASDRPMSASRDQQASSKPLDHSSSGPKDILELCQRMRDAWGQRDFSHFPNLTWPDCFMVAAEENGTLGTSQTSEPSTEVNAFLRSLDKVVPSSEAPVYETQGPLGVVRWECARFHVGDKWQTVDVLNIVMQRNSQWRLAVGIFGDWGMTSGDRYDPNNSDHVALQRLLDQGGEAMVRKDAAAIRNLMHPDARNFPGGQIVSRRSDFTDAMFANSSIEKHQHTITAVKVQGPLAVTLSQLVNVGNGQSTTHQGILNIYGRTKEGWRLLVWVAGEWTNVLMAERADASSTGVPKAATATESHQAPPSGTGRSVPRVGV